MRLELHNLGAIRHAELDLRPLTVLVGANGLNKSWTAYAAYACLRHVAFERLLRPGIGAPHMSQADVLASFPGPDAEAPWVWSARVDHAGFLPGEASSDASTLQQVIGADVARRARAALRDVSDPARPPIHAVEIEVTPVAGQFKVSASFVGVTADHQISGARDRAEVERTVHRALDRMHRARFSRAVLMPVERVSELEGLLQGGSAPSDGGVLDHLAWWVRASAHRLRRPSGDVAAFPGLSFVTGTRIDVGEALELAEVRGGARVPLRAAATMTRGLAALDVYLRTLAVPGDWIIIDEPELCAHPEGQVAIAEWLATLVAKGLRFIITTHSPYLLDHLETLVVARHGGRPAIERVRQRRPGVPDEAFLAPTDLAVYEFVDERDGVVVRSAYDPAQPAITTQTFGRVSDAVMAMMVAAAEP
jgi:hypothetical protein